MSLVRQQISTGLTAISADQFYAKDVPSEVKSVQSKRKFQDVTEFPYGKREAFAGSTSNPFDQFTHNVVLFYLDIDGNVLDFDGLTQPQGNRAIGELMLFSLYTGEVRKPKDSPIPCVASIPCPYLNAFFAHGLNIQRFEDVNHAAQLGGFRSKFGSEETILTPLGIFPSLERDIVSGTRDKTGSRHVGLWLRAHLIQMTGIFFFSLNSPRKKYPLERNTKLYIAFIKVPHHFDCEATREELKRAWDDTEDRCRDEPEFGRVFDEIIKNSDPFGLFSREEVGIRLMSYLNSRNNQDRNETNLNILKGNHLVWAAYPYCVTSSREHKPELFQTHFFTGGWVRVGWVKDLSNVLANSNVSYQTAFNVSKKIFMTTHLDAVKDRSFYESIRSLPKVECTVDFHDMETPPMRPMFFNLKRKREFEERFMATMNATRPRESKGYAPGSSPRESIASAPDPNLLRGSGFEMVPEETDG